MNKQTETHGQVRFDENQVREIQAIAARIEALGKILFLDFPRTSPGAIAAVHKADQYYRPQRYRRGRIRLSASSGLCGLQPLDFILVIK